MTFVGKRHFEISVRNSLSVAGVGNLGSRDPQSRILCEWIPNPNLRFSKPIPNRNPRSQMFKINPKSQSQILKINPKSQILKIYPISRSQISDFENESQIPDIENKSQIPVPIPEIPGILGFIADPYSVVPTFPRGKKWRGGLSSGSSFKSWCENISHVRFFCSCRISFTLFRDILTSEGSLKVCIWHFRDRTFPSGPTQFRLRYKLRKDSTCLVNTSITQHEVWSLSPSCWTFSDLCLKWKV